MSGTLLAMMLGAVPLCGMAAAPAPPPRSPPPQSTPSQNSSASHAAAKNPPPSRLQSLQPGSAGKNNQIVRVGRMSSRPWTEIVGWHPGRSQFPDGENQQSQLILVAVKF